MTSKDRVWLCSVPTHAGDRFQGILAWLVENEALKNKTSILVLITWPSILNILLQFEIQTLKKDFR